MSITKEIDRLLALEKQAVFFDTATTEALAFHSFFKLAKARIEDGADPIVTLQELETHVDTVIGRYQSAHASILVQAANFQNRLI